MRIDRLALAALAALAAATGGLAASAAPSLALVGYAPTSQFGAPGSGDGQLEQPAGIAVEEATGDVYVADEGNNRVQEFDATGKYLGQFDGSEASSGRFSGPDSVAVDNSKGPASGDVYVADVGHAVVDVFDAAGKYLSQLTGTPEAFGQLLGLAVDTTGDVWIYDSNGNVDEFSDKGSLIAKFNTGRGAEPGFALDSKGDIYLLFGSGNIGKLTPTFQQLEEWGAGGHALAVSLATGDVFLDKEGAGIEEYGPFGEPFSEALESFTTETGLSGSSNGIAVNGSDGTVYASESTGGQIAIFKDVGLLADASTGTASSVDKGAATVAGTVKRDGLPTKYRFVYGQTSAYGASSSTGSVAGEEAAVSVQLTGLKAETTYHYMLVAENEHGESFGQDQTFTTGGPAVEDLSTGPASALTTSSATVSGSLAPNGLDTHYYFEYGESEAYGAIGPALPGSDAGSASQPEPAETSLAGLEPSTTYHYRLVGVNALGATDGKDATFKTLAVPVTVNDRTPTTSDITRTAALVSGTLDTNNGVAEYHIDYVEAEEYEPAAANPYTNGGTSQIASAQAMRGDQAVAALPLSGLRAETTYDYRLVASNETGTTYGPNYTFTTAPATLPAVSTGAASEVTQTGVLLHGVLDTQELQTSYEFEVGTDTSYSGAKLFGNAGSNGSEAVSVALQYLIPGTTYHYRLVASNEDGTSYGQDMTFTTPGVSASIAQPSTLAFVPSPTVVFPSAAGAITKPQGSGKRKAKVKRKKVKRKVKPRGRRGAKAKGKRGNGNGKRGGARRS